MSRETLRRGWQVRLWVLLLAVMLTASACGGDDEEATETTAEGDTSTTIADAESPQGQDAAPTTTSSTTTTTTIPAARLGVVLLAPDDPNNSLNIRSGPGTNNPRVDQLEPAQADLVATGAVEVVDGRIWHEIVFGDSAGWAYGYYLTETLTPEEVDQEWDWKQAIDQFANALVVGEGLSEVVSWRGLFVIHFDDDLRRWSPEDLAGLPGDETELQWSNTGASAGESEATVGTWKEVIADAFLSDYLDQDVDLEVGGMTLGANSVLPEAAISSAFVNFPWVAIHDPGDNEDFLGLDWSTWFVFLEMETDGPRVVGLQPQRSYP